MFLLLFCITLILVSVGLIIWMNNMQKKFESAEIKENNWHITDFIKGTVRGALGRIDTEYELELARNRVNGKKSLF